MVNILVSNKRMDRGDVADIERQLVSERRLNNLRIHIIEVSPRKIMTSLNFSIMSDRVPSNIILDWETSFIA